MNPSHPDTLMPACILHRRHYRNTSLLLELFTPEEGRLPAIARGAKSARASHSALLQPFIPLLISLRGRGEIRQLAKVEANGRACELTGERLYCGFYLNELLMRLLGRRDPFPGLFAYYLDTLHRLAAGESTEQCLRYFELSLLQELGYGLLLERTADTDEPVRPEERYLYLIEQGPISQATGPAEQQIDGRTLLCLHNREELDSRAAGEAKRLLRRVLAFYLGDRPLKSRELFRGLERP